MTTEYGLREPKVEIELARKLDSERSVYHFNIKGFFIGKPDTFQHIVEEIKKTFRLYILLLKDRKRLGEIEKLLDKGKVEESKAYFKVVETIIPTLRDNPRWVEIEDTFNILDDKLHTQSL